MNHKAVKSFIKKRRYLINFLVFIIAILLFSAFKQTKGITVTVAEDSLRIAYPSQETILIEDSDIKAMDITDDLDLGRFIEGVNTKKYQYGIWENDQYGQYNLAVQSGTGRYIIVGTDSAVYIFNFESKDATANLFTAYLEHLQENGIALPGN